ncbi:plasmid mobilization protein [Syntrophomonas wolfei]|jgi:hypothetical protein|uniref:plasmid mobilization protein n=1 Tax=Syntrophomonas wolfei TaxID=863 RepID=UPI0023F402CE|nr:hypothetical protein [Syntrophomonas wolfei]
MVRKEKIKHPGPGRPAMSEDEKRRPRSFKATDEEWQKMQSLADQEGISVAELIRQRVLGAD